MFCTKCGNKIFENDCFCGNCGKKLKDENLKSVHPDDVANSISVSNVASDTTTHIFERNDEKEQKTAEVVDTISTGESYDKIGGFLILLAIGLFVAPFFYVKDIADSLIVLNGGNFELFKDSFKSFVYFNTASSLFLLIFLFFLCANFLKKRRNFPKLLTIYYVFNISITIIILISIEKIGLAKLMESKDLQDMSTSLFSVVISALIWIPYLFISKRSKCTFIN